MTERTSPPVSLNSWLEQVDDDPKISSEFKNGAQDQLKLSSTAFSSGSELKPSESLHLRVIWSKYVWIRDLRNLMVDDPNTGYTGYVSAENLATANLIFNSKRGLWQSYFKELGIRKAELDKSSGTQAAGVSRDIEEVPTADDLRRTSSISKPGPESSFQPAAMPTPSAVNIPITPYKPVLDSRTEQETPTPDVHSTPEAVSYYPARGGESNKPATDEYYVNTALLDLLHRIKLDVGVEFSSLDWLAKRLPLKLMETFTTRNSETGKIEKRTRKLMEARLDGYLCQRPGPFEGKLNTEPLAILEAKPYTRSSALASIRRQEGAEMACWIHQAGRSKIGLLKSSTSGRKRRLMVSQDRHEIYIIVAEYGAGFERHINPSLSVSGGSAKSQKKTGKPGSSTSTHVDSFSAKAGSTADRRDPRLLAGSPSYIKRVERKSIEVLDEPRGRTAQPTRAPPTARKSSRTGKKWVPDASDFLIMHEFGPFITTDPIHMEILIKRLIALILQLRGPQDRFVPERPGPEFLVPDDQVAGSTPNQPSSHPNRTLKKSRSWPATN